MVVPDDRALARLAAGQGGLFTTDDAARCGLDPRELARRVAAGHLAERAPGVYGPAHLAPDVVAVGRAALLSLGPTAVLSHLSAAHVWGLRRDLPQRAWVTVPYARTAPVLPGVEVVRSRHLAGARRRVNGVPVTCAARTVVDLGRVLERDDVEAALATALQRRLATVEEVMLWLQQAWRTAGTGLVRDVLKHFDPAWESLLSARLGRLLQQAGLDLVPGFGVRDPAGRLVAVADFACPRRRLLVEADGWAFHGSKEQQQADRERDRALLLLGWTTVRFTTHDVVREPARTVQELVRLLSRLAA